MQKNLLLMRCISSHLPSHYQHTHRRGEAWRKMASLACLWLGCILISGNTHPPWASGTSVRCCGRNHFLHWDRAWSHWVEEQRRVKLSIVSTHKPRSNIRFDITTLNRPQWMHKMTHGRHAPAKRWRRMAWDTDEFQDDRTLKFRLKDLLPF